MDDCSRRSFVNILIIFSIRFSFVRYARPATGGRKVRHHNFNHDVNDAVGEVKYLCQTIQQCGQKNPIDGTSEITLGNYLM